MSGGMLRMFDADPSEITDELMMGMVAVGHAEIVDAGPPPSYRLTQAGRRHVEEELFPSLGVTHGEGMAWMTEQIGDPVADAE